MTPAQIKAMRDVAARFELYDPSTLQQSIPNAVAVLIPGRDLDAFEQLVHLQLAAAAAAKGK